MADVERLFVESGAVLHGHFLLSSGLHSPVYWEKFRILESPRYTEQLCAMIARHYRSAGVEVVAGMVTGGMLVAYEVARQLGVHAIFAEAEGSGKAFRRGFKLDPGQPVLVVDDVMTTGGSVQQIMGEVDKLGGKIIGVGVLLDRSGGQTSFGVPFFSCHQVLEPTYKPDACPLCSEGVPLVKPGSSKQAAGK